MDTEYTIFISVAAIALGTALLAMITQWLKADDAASEAEIGVRIGLQRLHETSAAGGAGIAVTRTLADDEASVALSTGRMADDETTLGRFFAGWGGAGMLLGLAFGGTMWGATGALLGGVGLSTLAVGAVVAAVLVLDRVHAHQAEAQRLAAEARAQQSAPSAQGTVRAIS